MGEPVTTVAALDVRYSIRWLSQKPRSRHEYRSLPSLLVALQRWHLLEPRCGVLLIHEVEISKIVGAQTMKRWISDWLASVPADVKLGLRLRQEVYETTF